MGTEIAIRYDIVIYDGPVEHNDWSIIDELGNKIDEAKSLINKAEGQLNEKYSNILFTIRKIEDEIKRRTPLPPESEPVVKTDEELSDRQLYKKIAGLTHPDKLGDDVLFKKAKEAFKNKNRNKLEDLLAEARASYLELLAIKRKEYEELVSSVPFLIASDWFSDDFNRKLKAETYFLNILMCTMQAKQVELNGIVS